MVKIDFNENTQKYMLNVMMEIDHQLMRDLPHEALTKATEEIVKQVVDKIVAEKFGEVLSKVDTQAIANLSIARCATKIAEQLMERLDKK